MPALVDGWAPGGIPGEQQGGMYPIERTASGGQPLNTMSMPEPQPSHDMYVMPPPVPPQAIVNPEELRVGAYSSVRRY